MSENLIDTELQVQQMLGSILKLKGSCLPRNPFLFIDLEGVNLSRNGSISIMQVLVPPMNSVYLLDIYVLKDVAFNTKSETGITLKQLLQSDEWAKVFFDVRNDSDALFSHFGVDLKSVIDVQLLEFATRRRASNFVNGLAKCIENDLAMDYAESAKSNRIKNAGKRLFAPELGGKYEVFLQRPLPAALAEYCTLDVSVMPKLLMTYGEKLKGNKTLTQSIFDETDKRIALSKTATYNGKGRHMAVGPSLNRYGASSSSEVQFPMSVVFSGDLPKYCTKDDEKPGVDASSSLESGIKALNVASSETPTPGISATDRRTFDPSYHSSYRFGSQRNRNLGYYRSSDDEDEYDKDLTACDKECGYCGRCSY